MTPPLPKQLLLLRRLSQRDRVHRAEAHEVGIAIAAEAVAVELRAAEAIALSASAPNLPRR
jgi:hypothetical protein